SVCLVLASAHYDESDYIRDWHEYVAAVNAPSAGAMA
ncbi:MAG: WxcM-like domain-containing protein, partial [Acidobacteriota bacterium]|nr:WxcM-like domain-containing protein [Acidobacteriota bacterium]